MTSGAAAPSRRRRRPPLGGSRGTSPGSAGRRPRPSARPARGARSRRGRRGSDRSAGAGRRTSPSRTHRSLSSVAEERSQAVRVRPPPRSTWSNAEIAVAAGRQPLDRRRRPWRPARARCCRRSARGTSASGRPPTGRCERPSPGTMSLLIVAREHQVVGAGQVPAAARRPPRRSRRPRSATGPTGRSSPAGSRRARRSAAPSGQPGRREEDRRHRRSAGPVRRRRAAIATRWDRGSRSWSRRRFVV